MEPSKARFAKNALIEMGPNTGRIHINGEEFPYHVTGFDLETHDPDQPQVLTLRIPLTQGAQVSFDANEDFVEEPANTPFGRIGDIIRVDEDTAEPAHNLVLRVNGLRERAVLRWGTPTEEGVTGWFWGDELGPNLSLGPWSWENLTKLTVFHGEYMVVGIRE